MNGRPWIITQRGLLALAIGSVGGSLFMLLLIRFDHAFSSNEFCTGCHSMTFAAETYQRSSHFNSSSGVRAECGHCHVSRGILAATWDHILGTRDLLKQLFGADYDDPVINTLHLPDAAFTARRWFRANDSATCRACHVQDAIQGRRADTAEIHRVDAKGKTCIDCHYNLVHRKVPDESTFKREAWNRMVEEEFGLAAGSAAQRLGK